MSFYLRHYHRLNIGIRSNINVKISTSQCQCYNLLFNNMDGSVQAASTDLKQLGFSVATRGMESAVEDLSQLLNANSQLVESDDRPVIMTSFTITI